MTAQIGIRIPDDLRETLEVKARQEKRSLSNLIRLILEEYAEQHTEKNAN